MCEFDKGLVEELGIINLLCQMQWLAFKTYQP